jgi:hypothetical protein
MLGMNYLETLPGTIARRKPVAFFVGVVAFLLIAFVDYVTSEEFSFAVFYLVPIALFIWAFDSKWATAIALISVVVWPLEHIVSGDAQYFRSFVVYWEAGIRMGFYAVFIVTFGGIKRYVTRLHETNNELKQALSEVRQLRGLLPMCSYCKKIRDDANDWIVLEKYIQTHSDATVSHGMCPECAQKLYPELYEQMLKKKAEK